MAGRPGQWRHSGSSVFDQQTPERESSLRPMGGSNTVRGTASPGSKKEYHIQRHTVYYKKIFFPIKSAHFPKTIDSTIEKVEFRTREQKEKRKVKNSISSHIAVGDFDFLPTFSSSLRLLFPAPSPLPSSSLFFRAQTLHTDLKQLHENIPSILIFRPCRIFNPSLSLEMVPTSFGNNNNVLLEEEVEVGGG